MDIHIYRVSGNCRITRRVQVERVKPSRKVLYRFAIFAIFNEKLNNKDRSIRANRSARREETSYCNKILGAWRSGGRSGRCDGCAGCVRAARNARTQPAQPSSAPPSASPRAEYLVTVGRLFLSRASIRAD